jgi:hypothetical protein
MPEPITRREFAGLVVAGTIVSNPTDANCAGNSAEDKPATEAKPISPVELLVDLVRDKYPDERLKDAALEEIRSDFRHFVGRSKTLSSFPLVNADEPGFIFSAWRSDPPTP